MLVSPPPPPASLTITKPAELARVGNVVVIEGVGAPITTGLRYAVAVYQGTGVAPSIVWTKVGQADVDDAGAFALTAKLAGVGKTQLGLALLVRSLSGGGAAESQRGSFVRNVVIAPPPPALTKPNVNPFAQSSTTLAVAGTGASGAQISVFIDGSPLALSPALLVASGSFSRSVVVPKGVHVLTVTQTLDGQASAATPGQLLRIGDVVPPQITVARPSDQPPPTSSDTGANVDVVALRGITAVDVGGTTPLAVTCSPLAGSLLPVGTTQVVCTAKDAAGNVASTTQAVTVRSSVTPVVTGTSVVAEATGPQGAAVAYQVAATGSVADCAPPGSSDIVPCTSWRPVNTGLGFHVSTIAVDPKDGALYASAYDDPNGASDATAFESGTLFKSTDQGSSWAKLSLPGPGRTYSRSARLRVAPGVLTTDPSTLYIPTRNGLLASKGGAPATMILSGIDVGGVSVDPNDVRHVLSWNTTSQGVGPIVLFESTNGGQTWSLAAGIAEDASDMDYPHITDVVFDRLHPGRVYAQVAPWQRSDPNSPERVYRRIGTGPWVRLAVPPVQYANERWAEAAIAVAPSLPPCGGAVPCQTFATVFAAGAMSIDGGENWAAVPGLQFGIDRMVFDSLTPGRILAFEDQKAVVSVDFGQHFEILSTHAYGWFSDLVQDPAQGAVFYALTDEGSLMKSSDAGASWSALKAPASNGMARTILDVAVSPVDARVAYLLARDGFYRTGDGGDSWTLATNGIAQQRDMAVYNKYGITIDPFNSQTIYLSAFGSVLVWTDRPDQPLLPWTFTAASGFLAADPGAANVFYGVSPYDGTGSASSPKGCSRDYALNLSGEVEPGRHSGLPRRGAHRGRHVPFDLDGRRDLPVLGPRRATRSQPDQRRDGPQRLAGQTPVRQLGRPRQPVCERRRAGERAQPALQGVARRRVGTWQRRLHRARRRPTRDRFPAVGDRPRQRWTGHVHGGDGRRAVAEQRRRQDVDRRRHRARGRPARLVFAPRRRPLRIREQ